MIKCWKLRDEATLQVYRNISCLPHEACRPSCITVFKVTSLTLHHDGFLKNITTVFNSIKFTPPQWVFLNMRRTCSIFNLIKRYYFEHLAFYLWHWILIWVTKSKFEILLLHSVAMVFFFKLWRILYVFFFNLIKRYYFEHDTTSIQNEVFNYCMYAFKNMTFLF